jgi:hypothetical protein
MNSRSIIIIETVIAKRKPSAVALSSARVCGSPLKRLGCTTEGFPPIVFWSVATCCCASDQEQKEPLFSQAESNGEKEEEPVKPKERQRTLANLLIERLQKKVVGAKSAEKSPKIGFGFFSLLSPFPRLRFAIHTY